MSSYIIPSLIIALVVYSFVKKKNAYNDFVFGAKTSFDLILISFPYIVAIFIAIEVFEASGLSDYLASLLKPALNLVGIPSELIPMVLIKPFSGCGSLAVLENIFINYGAELSHAKSRISFFKKEVLTRQFCIGKKLGKIRMNSWRLETSGVRS